VLKILKKSQGKREVVLQGMCWVVRGHRNGISWRLSMTLGLRLAMQLDPRMVVHRIAIVKNLSKDRQASPNSCGRVK
jgi:hypothetical protein